MQKVTIKAYAVKHKLSIFNVMKMVKSATLKSEVVDVAGKETIYILHDEHTESAVKKDIISIDENNDMKLKHEVYSLKNEVDLLRREIEEMKKLLH